MRCNSKKRLPVRAYYKLNSWRAHSMTREEIIKEAIDYVQIGRFGYYKGTYNEMLAVLKFFADTDAEYVNFQDYAMALI